MAKIELVLPSMGEGITDATVIRFLKLVGEKVEEDESIFEVATDKVDTEIPAPVAGILTEIHIKEGDIVSVDQVIAIIESEQVGDVQKNKIEEIVPISTKSEGCATEIPSRSITLIFVAAASNKSSTRWSGSRFTSST